MSRDLRQTVVELLGQLGSSREARQYLQQFSRVEETRFAVVKVGGGVLRDQLEELAAALAFLHRLGLTPIILHGAGPQLDDALSEAGVTTEKCDGLRVTTEDVMAVARPVIYGENNRVVDALEMRGVRARGILHGVFESRLADRERLGLVGNVEAVNLAPLRAAVQAGMLPVVACLGESRSGQVLNINADVAARELVGAVCPHKVIFLTPTGGLLDENGRVISALSLNTDYDSLMGREWVHSGMRLKLEQIREMLLALPPEASVSITSAANLTRELFTHGGAGTLIRRGERIDRLEALEEDLRSDVETLIENSFERRLRPDWLDGRELEAVYVAESRRAAAVILKGWCGAAYLDKFAVTPEARGEGLAAALWAVLDERHPALYWRARLANPVNNWYFQQAGTTVKRGGWVAFTRGLADMEAVVTVCEDALARDSGWAAPFAPVPASDTET